MDRRTSKYYCYLGQQQRCSYLPYRISQVAYLDPDSDVSTEQYSELVKLGFRRSGRYVYRPSCPDCQSCQTLRIPTKEFVMSRSQQRNWRRNRDVAVHRLPPVFQQAHFSLYQRYQQQRHPDSNMASSSTEDYLDFLTCPNITTEFAELRIRDRLLAVAVYDCLDDGLSAVYTFFDPELSARGPGVYSVLWQIAEAENRGLDWLYLGYWIKNCRKMSYKDNFRPCQILVNGRWQNMPGHG